MYTSHASLHHLKRSEAFGLHPRHLLPDLSTNHVSVDEVTNYTNSTILQYTAGLDGLRLDIDHTLIKWLWVTMVAVALLVLVCRGYLLLYAHLRHIYSMSATAKQQNYWSFDKTSYWPMIKQKVLYAPLGKKRHNREIRLSEAVNVGTLPTRFQTFMLLLYIGSNITYCLILDYSNPSKAALIAEVRGRTGILATANMIPLIIFASRNNPAIPILKVSFDSFNLLHRWIGRMVALEAIAHTLAWGANSVSAKGMSNTMHSVSGDMFLIFGMVGSVAVTMILFLTPSVVRHAFYETFLHLHQLLAVAVILGVYAHLEIANLPAIIYIRPVVGLWAGERVVRILRILYLNVSYGRGCTKVVVEALPGEACRVTMNLPRHITIRPGSHVYAYFPKISMWMSHPFSVAWTNVDSEPPTGLRPDIPMTPASLEKQSPGLPSLEYSKTPTTVSLVIAARTGMTRTLYNKAMASSNHVIRMPGFLEGPYYGHDSLSSYGTVILFAAGSGITHHLVQIRHLIASAQAGIVATRKIVLIWSVKNVETLAWVRPWMDEILQMEGRRDVLKVQLFVTKPRSPRDMVSPSATIKLYPGRCKPDVILDDEIPARVGATAVSVCGPGGFADEVRAAVRARLHWGCLDFDESAFTW